MLELELGGEQKGEVMEPLYSSLACLPGAELVPKTEPHPFSALSPDTCLAHVPLGMRLRDSLSQPQFCAWSHPDLAGTLGPEQ